MNSALQSLWYIFRSLVAGLWRCFVRALPVLVVIGVLLGIGVWYNLFRQEPQVLADDTGEEYFKYGSIGTEEEEGLPYYVWLVLPRMFPEHLPKDAAGQPKPGGYAAFGVGWEQGRETPVGFSKRTIGFPRIAINCAVCHSTTYRTGPKESPHVVPTGPSQRMDIQAYQRFLTACASDPRFTPRSVLAEIQYNVKLTAFEKLLYRFVIIPQTRTALMEQGKRFAWTYEHGRPNWGAGRIDPFNPVKFHQLELEPDETIGNSDMMPLWNMEQRTGSLHWDGLNTDLTEVVQTGAIGDGATNKSLPVERLAQIEAYLRTKQPPSYPFPDRIDSSLVAQGQPIFQQHCARCHAHGGERTGTVIPLDEIGTDPHRAAMWTDAAVESYSRYADGYPWDFTHFQNEEGYVAVPLDGLWLRAPYLHNGSVPSLEDLLLPPSARPRQFYRGSDIVDRQRVGFLHQITDPQARHDGYLYDVTARGNSNAGHTYGTDLAPEQKRALIEYLKTL